jgi:uncharacterized delta-60 repeat protein
MRGVLSSRPRILTFAFILAVALLAVPGRPYAAPGDLDPTFGTGGKVIAAIGATCCDGDVLTLQPDGKLVVAGFANSTPNLDFALARYTSTGGLDTTFVTTDFGGNDIVTGIAIQPDGKIVAVGLTQVGSGPLAAAITRYNSDGTQDTTFGTSGKTTTTLGVGAVARAVAIQVDGKILVAGSVFTEAAGVASADFLLARYTATGTLDVTFGTGGIVTTDFAGLDDIASAVTIQADGKIVLAGLTLSPPNSLDFALARYNSNGTLDSGFGNAGKVITVADGGQQAFAIVMQPDSKIVVAGDTATAGNSDFAVRRYNSNGALDASFGSSGTVITDFGSDEAARAVAIQTDGKIIVAGARGEGNNTDFALARYMANGTLDTSFGVGGKVTTNVGGIDWAMAMELQPDNKILVAGRAGDHPGIVRYEVGSCSIQQIVDVVASLIRLTAAQRQALTAALQAALARAEDGDEAAAIARLEMFIRAVNSLVERGRLTPAVGASLVEAAECGIALLMQ